ncbi:uncharacterized protein EAF01_008859 [Botrytis porri]|uniref:DUF7770 domain-containing protein n=1 Tax=Botrytis porri TaxID=87229 RepID=A0A4Z1KQQ3_9HELO|nr:uncharacterized protein EAF01_008859 [Botrytis porri]KAF7897893.1 hypothetical protein EAF01_008859 [Botrytis porri]TGO86334.1 hypothetical protein BPOR_0313g00140 [Botrytis porri]
MSSRKYIKPSSSSTKPRGSNSATRDIEEGDYELKIQKIRVTVHTTGKFFPSDTRSGNHASIYLLTSNNASVRLNMAKLSADATMGTYQTIYCSYQDTNSSLKDFDLKATGRGLTVGHVLGLVEEKNRDKYKLARSGLGCRHWVRTIINDLHEAGYISSSSPLSTEDALNALKYNYSKGKNPEREDIDPGTFVSDIPKKVKKIKKTDTTGTGSESHRSTGSGSEGGRRR